MDMLIAAKCDIEAKDKVSYRMQILAVSVFMAVQKHFQVTRNYGRIIFFICGGGGR
jgi:hypothetical protein